MTTVAASSSELASRGIRLSAAMMLSACDACRLLVSNSR